MKKIIILLSLLALQAKAQNIIKIDGSSTVFPITEGVSEEFQTSTKGKTKVTVGVSGTGGGFKKFCRAETDIQDASRPITVEELATCKAAGVQFIELPVAFDAIAIVVNKQNNWVNEITVEELKKMWEPEAQGKVMTWKQVNAKWPDEKLSLFGASTDNGTFDYFTEAVVGKAKSSRGDYSQSVDHNTRVAGVSSTKAALGYIPFSYYSTNKDKLKLLALVGGEKAPKKTAVLPSEKTVVDGSYFPLSRPIFIYVSKKALERPEVKEFVTFYIKNASMIAKQVQYIALPEAAYKAAMEHVEKQKIGTVFAKGSQIGIKIEELMKKEATF